MRKTIGFGSMGLFLALGLFGSEALAVTTPVVVNPGFEADGTGVATPQGWTESGSVNASFTEFGGHSGSFRLSNWSSDDYSVTTEQTVRGLRGDAFTMKAWVKRSPGQNNSYIELDCGAGAERTYLPVAPADEWLQIVVSARKHRDACTLRLHTDATGGEWTNFDDIE
ncbi:MAG TPA: hypothetical protein VIM73_17390, partial [Polyangiaceae bacterium]